MKQKILKRKPAKGNKTLKIKSALLADILQRALDGDTKGVRGVLDEEFPGVFKRPRHKQGEPAAAPAETTNTDREILRPLRLERPSELVETKAYVYDTVCDLFERLHDNEPDHPIFGEPEKGVMRLPLGNRSGANGKGTTVSWCKQAAALADSVQECMGTRIERGAC